MHFWCHDTTLKKMFLVEKSNLTWNKQTNFSKLGLLSRVFQIALRGKGMGNLPGEFFLLGDWVVNIWQRICHLHEGRIPCLRGCKVCIALSSSFVFKYIIFSSSSFAVLIEFRVTLIEIITKNFKWNLF